MFSLFPSRSQSVAGLGPGIFSGLHYRHQSPRSHTQTCPATPRVQQHPIKCHQFSASRNHSAHTCTLQFGGGGWSQGKIWNKNIYKVIFFLAATKQLYKWYFPSVCPSVCPSVRLSVCPSHLFDYVPIIVSSWNFQELLLMTDVRSMQKVKVRGQRSRSQRSRPNFSFPDCNSSLNSHMMMKWYI